MSNSTINNLSQKRTKTPVFHDFVICILLVAALVVVYAQVRTFTYINFDDNEYIVENKILAKGLTKETVVWAFTDSTHISHYWHPLTWLSHLMDAELFGMDLGKHHLINLIFHILNTLLLFFLFKVMTGSTWRSAFMAALFALHPLRVESVAWLAERKDMLSGFFWMLTLLAYFRYAKAPGIKNYLLVFVFFLFGLMSKPMVVTLPFVMLLLDFWPLGRINIGQKIPLENRLPRIKRVNLILEKVPFLLLIIPIGIATYLTQIQGGAVHSLDVVPFWDRITNCMVTYVAYIEKMIWPGNLAFVYPDLGPPPVWQAVGAGLLLSVITFFTLYYIKPYPWLTVGWLWYVGVLFPVNGLVVIGPHVMADRYTYLPLIGLFLIVSWGGYAFAKSRQYTKQIFAVFAILILTVFSVITYKTAGHWKNPITACRHAIKVTSDNYVAHNNLGFFLAGQGEMDEAVRHYKEALRIRPGCVLCMNNLGNTLLQLDRVDKAIKLFSKSLAKDPDQAGIHYRLGNALVAVGKAEAAAAHYQRALKIEPLVAGPYIKLGDYLLHTGNTKAAVKHYQKAIEVDPNQGEAHNSLAIALIRLGMLDEALYHGREALRLNPDEAEAHNNLGVILTMHGRINEAVNHLQKALQLKPDYMDARNNLNKIISRRK